MLVMTGIDFEQKEQLYDQTCQSLRKFKGQATGGATGGTMSTTPIKVEPTYMASTSSNRYYRRPRNFNTPNKRMDKTKERKINPKGPDGQLLTCRACGSFRHLIRECPDSWENLSKVNIATVDSETYPEEHVVLFTGYNKPEVTQLDMEASNCAILDSACSSTVCGKDWMENYVDSLSEEEKASVKRFEGSRIFKFGGGTTLHSKGEYEIPATIVSNSVRIWTDVVDSHIPLLLSREAMKKAEVRLDIRNDSAEIFGKQVSLNVTSSGHYCVYLQKEIPVEDVCVVNLEEISNEERQKVILKLHRQFAHPPEKRLIAFMKDAGAWKEDYRSLVSSIQSSCDLCKMYMKTLPRPVVSMPMATKFNEKVAMDLKQWGNRWILHMIDMWSRLTVSVFLDRKRPCDVIDKIMTNWIGAGFGVMKSVMTDNGGEFSSDELREVASMLNIQVCTSAAYSPFQNGLCERVHAVTDMMLHKLTAEHPNTSPEVLLGWANMARNSLQMWNGYSSYQLVFGQNPNLPDVMTDTLQQWRGALVVISLPGT